MTLAPRLEVPGHRIEQPGFDRRLFLLGCPVVEARAEVGVPTDVVAPPHLIFEKARQQQALRAGGLHHLAIVREGGVRQRSDRRPRSSSRGWANRCATVWTPARSAPGRWRCSTVPPDRRSARRTPANCRRRTPAPDDDRLRAAPARDPCDTSLTGFVVRPAAPGLANGHHGATLMPVCRRPSLHVRPTGTIVQSWGGPHHMVAFCGSPFRPARGSPGDGAHPQGRFGGRRQGTSHLSELVRGAAIQRRRAVFGMRHGG